MKTANDLNQLDLRICPDYAERADEADQRAAALAAKREQLATVKRRLRELGGRAESSHDLHELKKQVTPLKRQINNLAESYTFADDYLSGRRPRGLNDPKQIKAHEENSVPGAPV
jgi:chromosome segregation ATPase